uniref:Protein K02A2.4 n=1 Tax=Caenorhabditis elegans TaxID=6239 RepID=Q7M3K7_CAEEL
MADDSNRFVLYFDVYYYSYFIIGVFAQSVLLYLIKNKSPPRLYSFCYFLINTWIVQFAVLLMTFFTQSRCLPNSTTYTVLPRGPCKYFGPTACFAGYHISLAVSMAVALSFANTVLFRYLPIRFHGFNKNLFFDDDNCMLHSSNISCDCTFSGHLGFSKSTYLHLPRTSDVRFFNIRTISLVFRISNQFHFSLRLL